MSDATTTLARLEATLTRLEALGLAAPELSAAVNPDGTPGPVAAGELIESAWGNAVVDSLLLRRGVSVSQSGQSIASGAQVDMTWAVESVDTDNYFTPGGATFTIPANRGGVYGITCEIFVNVAVAGWCAAELNVGGKVYWAYIPVGQQRALLTAVFDLAAAQTLKIRIINGHSAAATYSGTFQMFRTAF